MKKREKHDSGQIVLLLAFIITGLVFLLILNMDVFLAIRNKVRIQNAGDAAALAGARWQGITLNLIGDLNVAHLSAACSNPNGPDLDETLENIAAMQERLAFAGPVIGFEKANEAAMANGVPAGTPVTRKMEALVNESIRTAPEILADTPTWQGKGTDYANMLRAASRNGVCATVDNARYFTCNASGNHLLYNHGFYTAVKTRDWCWFCRCFGGHETAIAWLRNFSGWGELPPPENLSSIANSEFFGVSVMPGIVGNFTNDVNREAVKIIAEAAVEHGADPAIVNEESIVKSGALSRPGDIWYFYDYAAGWHPWSRLAVTDGDMFPLLSEVKQEYFVSGAIASSRVTGYLVPFSSGAETNDFVWTATAKPFGSVSAWSGLRPVTGLFDSDWKGSFPRNAPLVFPSFKFARLVPVGGADAHEQGNPDWIRHVREHVWAASPQYGSCSYCTLLSICENIFPDGAQWLTDNPHDTVCTAPGDGPADRGTRYGH
jgi:hypothetical protein